MSKVSTDIQSSIAQLMTSMSYITEGMNDLKKQINEKVVSTTELDKRLLMQEMEIKREIANLQSAFASFKIEVKPVRKAYQRIVSGLLTGAVGAILAILTNTKI